MPIYTFKNLTTGEVTEEVLSIAQRDERVKDPNIQQLISGAPSVSYGGTKTKPDAGFRDILKRIKSNNYKSNINTF